ncbi:MAG: substrate-binding domain-containing protein [Fimbriimonadales bacterium]|nr:substrate-binding domain-containing protein [Fimbriimonadales bacterium]
MREDAHDGALLLSPEIGSPLLEWRLRCSLPAVVVGATVPADYGLPCVDVDNEAAMRELTRWVIQQGHRAVGYVGGNPRHWSAQQRERAFRRTLAEMGVPLREEWVLEGRYSIDSGVEAARQLLQLPELPTVVICANDLMAVGLIQELQLHGVRVPQDLSVAGFDDEPQVQQLGYALTSIRHPMHEIGRAATEQLLQCLERGECLSADALLLPGLLIVRSSVRRFSPVGLA